MNRALLAGLLPVLILLADVDTIEARRYGPEGVSSNLVFFQDRVFFTQGSGSLTAIHVDTGRVVLRKRLPYSLWWPEKSLPLSFPVSVEIENTAEGLLLIGQGIVALLDRETGETRWSETAAYGVSVSEKAVVHHDGSHTVSCRKLGNGKQRWTHRMDSESDVRALNDRVLIATPEYIDKSSITMLDIETGRVLWKKNAPPGEKWERTHVDRKNVYIATSPRDWKDRIMRLRILDLEGRELGVREKSEEKANRLLLADLPFELEGTVFTSNGRAVPASDFTGAIESEGTLETYYGKISTRLIEDKEGEYGDLFEIDGSEYRWRGYLPYSRGRGSGFVENDGKLFIPSGDGRLECIDLKSGRPLWLYVFPVFIGPHRSCTTRYSVAERYRYYRQTIEEMAEARGLIRLPLDFDPSRSDWRKIVESTDQRSRVIIDPVPDDPFASLVYYDVGLGLMSVGTILAVLVILWLTRPTWNPRGKGPLARLWRGCPRKETGDRTLATCLLVLSVVPATGAGFLQIVYIDWSLELVSTRWNIVLAVAFVFALVATLAPLARMIHARRWVSMAVFTGVVAAWSWFGILLFGYALSL